MSEVAETTETTSKKAAPSPLLNKRGKFDDRLIARCKLPTVAQRQFYGSEVLKDGLSLRMVFGRKRARWYVATYDEHGDTIQTPLGYFPLPGCKLLPVFDSEEARDAARELFKDPQRTVREKQAGTFGEVSREWFKVKIKGRGLRSEREIERRLKNKFGRHGNSSHSPRSARPMSACYSTKFRRRRRKDPASTAVLFRLTVC